MPQKGNDATMMPFCGCFAGNRAYGIGIKREQAPGRVLPVWIDSTLRSARGSLGTAEALGQAFRRGLRLEI